MSARLPQFVSAGLVVLTLAAYGPLWRNDFIDLDDKVYVTDNDAVKQGLGRDSVVWAWTTFHGGFYFPLTWMSLEVDGSLFPLHDPAGRPLPNPAVFHGQNLLWHTATVVVLFAVLRRMTGALWRSAAVAALFAVHPLHVESVAWATERKDVLSTFFWVLTMLVYVRYVQTRGPAWYVAVVFTYLLGLLSKPMLVTLPCALLLLDVWPLGRLRWPAPAGGRRAEEGHEEAGAVGRGWVLLEKLPLFALAAGASWLAVITQRHANALVPAEIAPLPARLANAVVSCAWYLEKTFWPAGLAVFYPHPFTDWTWGPVIAAGVVLALVSLVVAVLSRRMPWLPIGWLWFLGTLAPVIGLVQVGMQARGDRFVYVPHIGLFVALVWTAAAVLERLRAPATVQAVLAGGILAVLTVLTARQVTFWHDTRTIWAHALAVTSDNHRGHANLAVHLAGLARSERSLQEARTILEEAREHAAKAVALAPTGEYQYNLGVVCLYQGDLTAAGEAFGAAVQQDPNHVDWWHNLGVVRLKQRRPVEAARALERALALERELGPKSGSEADSGRANTWANLGMAHWQQGQRARARACWDEALRLSPAEAVALCGQGMRLLQEGQVKRAVESFTAAVRAAPGMAQAQSNLGVALGRLDDWSAAAHHRQAIALETDRLSVQTMPDHADLALYRRRLAFTLMAFAQDREAAKESREALKLDPTWPARCTAEAWNLATAPDREAGDAATAYELASQACHATAEPSAEALDALAAAEAAAGRYAAAVKTARKALLRAAPGLARQIERRLERYEQGKAYTRGE
jgi:tetratricopeptide (TPR) repeat protein